MSCKTTSHLALGYRSEKKGKGWCKKRFWQQLRMSRDYATTGLWIMLFQNGQRPLIWWHVELLAPPLGRRFRHHSRQEQISLQKYHQLPHNPHQVVQHLYQVHCPLLQHRMSEGGKSGIQTTPLIEQNIQL